MIKIVTVIGARPQIIKAAAISREIKNNFQGKIKEIIIHTGQHYDENMSNVFFNELKIPKPDYNLNIGSKSHGFQTALMIQGIEDLLLKEKPDYVILYGDTNSTLAGSIAASKIGVPIAHIEAGLRSYNKGMPEEINRVLTDHVSTFLFPPTSTGTLNLEKEGFSLTEKEGYHIDSPGVFNFGDVMLDNSVFFSEIANEKSKIISKLRLENSDFVLATVHRGDNTDNHDSLLSIFQSLLFIAEEYDIRIILPLHPRTKKQLELLMSDVFQEKVASCKNLELIEPVSFLDMIALEKNCKIVITDSGGVQKEAYFFGKPCLILRPETEWKEIVDNGAAVLCNSNYDKIVEGFKYYYNEINDINTLKTLYGTGNTAYKIIQCLISNYKN